jgi:hypothetical protein
MPAVISAYRIDYDLTLRQRFFVIMWHNNLDPQILLNVSTCHKCLSRGQPLYHRVRPQSEHGAPHAAGLDTVMNLLRPATSTKE